jgi:DNA (cytosine-5)-methyltransferase 1
MIIEAVDLFCGAGGLTHGLENSGINVIAGYDIDAACRYAYESNNSAKFFEQDIVEIDSVTIKNHYSESAVKLLAGCAPCQPFSNYRQGKSKDHKWGLLYSFGKLIAETNPDLISMENVPELVRHKVYEDFLKLLLIKGYHVSNSVVFCPDYGIPQNRKRLVLLASKFGTLRLIEPTYDEKSYLTVKDVLGNLPSVKAGETDSNDPLHKANNLNDINMRRIKASKPNGSWKDWEDELKLPCHRRASGQKYVGVYGRMCWDLPSPTITTQFYNYGSGRFGHPEQNRAITLREAAILQSFPPSYKFVNPENERIKQSEIARLIGNAVPVKLAEIIGLTFVNHISELSK